jgi:transposase
MILNALGFSGRALYLTPRFYKSRPVDVLVGEGLTAEHLNDASLGTALDALYDTGITELFFSVSQQILTRYGIPTGFAHLDSTTFSLHGEYNSKYDPEKIPEGVIHITKGFSKDHAPDLNQVVLQLICTHKSSMPMWIETLSGNTSDKKSFAETVKAFQRQFRKDSMPYMVMDSAFYTQKNITECYDIHWVTRVPETVKEVRVHYATLDPDRMQECGNGYRTTSVRSTYGGVTQRWLLVYSAHAYEREIKTFEKNLAKRRDRNEKGLKHLRNTPFACQADAQAAAETFSKNLRYQSLTYTVVSKNRYVGKGRPAKDAIPDGVQWFIEGGLDDDDVQIEQTKQHKGRFVLATNELDETVLSDAQLLEVYKDQGVTVERGFRFLKDPLFYAESLYLKKPERIMALLMVMTLSLLMYSLAEMRIREALVQSGRHIWDQKNKPTTKPTIRWIFMIFEDILLLYQRVGESVHRRAMNIEDEHRIVLECLGPRYEKIYFL